MKICKGYATLQNNIAKKETLWKIKVCIWEIPVPLGGKAAGLNEKRMGMKPQTPHAAP